MRAFGFALVSLFLTPLIVGCAKPQATSAAPISAPTTGPSSKPVPAEPFTMIIDEHVYDFPPAKIILTMADQQMSALLLSEDPPNAASDQYQGNSIYLQMTIDIPDSNTLAGAEWTFKTAETERSEEVDGIYLQGHRKFLQPYDVFVRIENDTPPVKVLLQGTFLLFDEEDVSDPPAAATKVQVSAELPARVQLKPDSQAQQDH